MIHSVDVVTAFSIVHSFGIKFEGVRHEVGHHYWSVLDGPQKVQDIVVQNLISFQVGVFLSSTSVRVLIGWRKSVFIVWVITGLIWIRIVRIGLIGIRLVGIRLIWIRLIWIGLIGIRLIWIALIWIRLIRIRLVGIRLVGIGLIWIGLIWIRLIGIGLVGIGLVGIRLVGIRIVIVCLL